MTARLAPALAGGSSHVITTTRRLRAGRHGDVSVREPVVFTPPQYQ